MASRVGKNIVWKQQHSCGLLGIYLRTMCSCHIILQLIICYKSKNFWKYLQFRGCIVSESYNVAENTILNDLELTWEDRRVPCF